MSKKSRFQRPVGERRYKKLFVISVEGSKTEPQYFSILNELQSKVLIKCLKRPSTKSSPIQACKKMQGYLRKESLKKTDEAWIVIDKDEWTDDQLRNLMQWVKNSKRYGLAISNPNFEYWLLLHFEDGKGITNAQECLKRLKKHVPNYKKEIHGKKFTLERIKKALLRAKPRDAARSGSTTVHKLVARIIDHK